MSSIKAAGRYVRCSVNKVTSVFIDALILRFIPPCEVQRLCADWNSRVKFGRTAIVNRHAKPKLFPLQYVSNYGYAINIGWAVGDGDRFLMLIFTLRGTRSTLVCVLGACST